MNFASSWHDCGAGHHGGGMRHRLGRLLDIAVEPQLHEIEPSDRGRADRNGSAGSRGKNRAGAELPNTLRTHSGRCGRNLADGHPRGPPVPNSVDPSRGRRRSGSCRPQAGSEPGVRPVAAVAGRSGKAAPEEATRGSRSSTLGPIGDSSGPATHAVQLAGACCIGDQLPLARSIEGAGSVNWPSGRLGVQALYCP